MAEESIFRGSPSLLMRLAPVSAGVLALLVALAGLVWWGDAAPAVRWLLVAVAVAAIVYLVFEFFLNNATVYEVTSQRIRVSQGLLTRRTEELELYRANDTALIEPLFLRLFGLGTIEVRTMESSDPILQLRAVRGARALRESLRTHIEACRDRKRVRMAELDTSVHGDADDSQGH